MPQTSDMPAYRDQSVVDKRIGNVDQMARIAWARTLIECFRNQRTMSYSDRKASVGSTAAARFDGR
jgi:hypothetical protein